jgi:hypothetical protein
MLGQGYSLNLNGDETHKTFLGAIVSVFATGLITFQG